MRKQLTPALRAVAFGLLGWALWSADWVAPRLAGAAPWDLINFRRVESDPNASYDVKDDNGPWMILAVTFSGDGAEQQAHTLALELRKRYKMPAFVHGMNIDLSDAGTSGFDEKGKPRKMRYQGGSEILEIAVMVGNYPAVDDAQAQRDLKKLKYMRPECLEIKEGRKTSRPLAALRYMQQQIESGFIDDKKSAVVENVKAGMGPMANAFVTTNPLLPREYYVPDGLDQEVVEINRDIKFSLLDTGKRYSVKVATFTGNVIIDPRKIKAIESGRDMPSKLVEAALNAHDMTEALRAQGVEAYEFHDRYSSMVCVGAFDSIGSKMPDGHIELSPAVAKIMEAFGPKKQLTGGIPAAPASEPQSIRTRGREIPYDLQPMPVEIPRQSLARQFERRPERF